MEPFRIEASEFHHIWDKLLEEIYLHGKTSSPRNLEIKEKVGVSILLTDTYNNVLVNSGRELSYRFMVAEWLWISFGMNDVTTIGRYNARMYDFSDDGKTLAGAYGPLITSQVSYVVNKLKVDPASRQAVMTIFTPNPPPSRDIPCTTTFQFLIREDKLDAIVTMRSSDIWLGLPYDVFTFTRIQHALAAILQCNPGSFLMHLGSSHLYSSNEADARKAMFEYKSYTLKSPQLPSWPHAELEVVLINPNSVLTTTEHPWPYYANVLRQLSKHNSLWAIKQLPDQH